MVSKKKLLNLLERQHKVISLFPTIVAIKDEMIETLGELVDSHEAKIAKMRIRSAEKDKLIAEQAERIDKLVETLDQFRRPVNVGEVSVSFAAGECIKAPIEFVKEVVANEEATIINMETGKQVTYSEFYERITSDCKGECENFDTPECPFFNPEMKKEEVAKDASAER
jgi:polyribonucleotide nucleotidyltransferase